MQDEWDCRQAAEAQRLGNRIEQLDYFRSMIRQLREMAAADRFDMLTHYLEMAYLEASDQLRELHSAEYPEGTTEPVEPHE